MKYPIKYHKNKWQGPVFAARSEGRKNVTEKQTDRKANYGVPCNCRPDDMADRVGQFLYSKDVQDGEQTDRQAYIQKKTAKKINKLQRPLKSSY